MTLPRLYLFTLGLTLVSLFLILSVGLLPALLSGLLVYYVVESGSHLLHRIGVLRNWARITLLILLTLIVVSALVAGVLALAPFLSNGQESLSSLLQRMADIVSAAKNYLPAEILDYLPADVVEWQHTLSSWLRGNAGYISGIGKNAGMVILHILAGMIIGGLVALTPPKGNGGILTRALLDRTAFLGRAFKNIVFSQFKISALNTFLTSIFLIGVLPLSGNQLPFLKTMIAVTFIAGLLPIIGNLISNTIIFLIALGVSPLAAGEAIVFLVVIHKLEYFFNAQIIGVHINARAWEILLAMLVLESVFGLSGVVAAPIYYAYLKDELAAKKLI